MFTKIFKRVSIQSLISSYFFCVLASFFNTYCIKAGNIDLQDLVITIVLCFFFTYSHCHSLFFSSKEIKYFIWRHSPSLFPTMHPFV